MDDRLFLAEDHLHHRLKDDLQLLMEQQKQTWDLLRHNYEQMRDVETRVIEFPDSAIAIQYNPGRLSSTTAQIDEASLRSRPCFLCLHNLPAPQRALPFDDEFVVLCNPFPIFPMHFTVVHREHVPQRFESAMHAFLLLSRELAEEFVVLYNGPQCGASAPDHLHIQIGSRGFLPLVEEYERMIMQGGEKLADKESLVAFSVEAGGRRFVAIESDSENDVQRAIRLAFDALSAIGQSDLEPMVNILSWFQEGEWRVVVFPRSRHRPTCFNAPEAKRFLVSPAAVDLAGVLITPRRVDYERIGADDVLTIFGEVVLDREAFARFKEMFMMLFSSPVG